MRTSANPRAQFARASRWPKSRRASGIAHGWHGLAWVWTHLQLGGLADPCSRTEQSIRRRLLQTSARASDSISHLWGTAANAVVAALFTTVDASFETKARRLAAAWATTVNAGNAHTDVMRGTAGAILAASEIQSYLPGCLPPAVIRTLHLRCHRHLERFVKTAMQEPVSVGFAHGGAGLLLALETSATTFGHELSPAVRRSILDVLKRTRLRVSGRDDIALWPCRSLDAELTAHGWCHGGPGVALALLGCYCLTSRSDYWTLAAAALKGIPVCRNDHPSICCGSIGHVNILIEAYRITGDSEWLDAARVVMRRRRQSAAMRRELCRGLWKGRPGAAYTSLRLKNPDALPFPGLGLLSAQSARPVSGYGAYPKAPRFNPQIRLAPLT